MPTIRRGPRRRGVAIALVVLVSACGSGDDEVPAADAVVDADGSVVTTAPPPVLPDGVDRSLALVTEADGTICEICVWRATSSDQRSRGLMGVTDLGPADGMTFEYDEPRNGWFWMKNTVMPLSIAFFGADGSLVDSFDMTPCTSDPCVRYEPDGRYTLAIEVPQGGLADLGIADGSSLEVLDLSCEV